MPLDAGLGSARLSQGQNDGSGGTMARHNLFGVGKKKT